MKMNKRLRIIKAIAILLLSVCAVYILTACGSDLFKPAEREKKLVGNFYSISFPETTLYDNGEVAVTVRRFALEDGKDHLVLYGINNTEKPVIIAEETLIIDGICIHQENIRGPLHPVDAGEFSYKINTDKIEAYGLTDVHTLVVGIALDYETGEPWDYTLWDYAMTEEIVTSSGDDYERPAILNNEVYSDDNIKIVYTGFIEDEDAAGSIVKSKMSFLVYSGFDEVRRVWIDDVCYDAVWDDSNWQSYNLFPGIYSEIYVTCGEDIRDRETLTFTLNIGDATSREYYSVSDITVNLKEGVVD